MDLDARKPVIVILGAWNPAIFQPGWIARHLFGFSPGEQVGVTTLFAASPEPGLLYYLNDVGVGVNPQRLMVYVNSLNPDAFARAEAVASRALTTLHHTPIAAYGVNFAFTEAAASLDLVERLKARDLSRSGHEVIKERLVASIRSEDAPLLNLTRYYEGHAVGFEFNFHFDGAPTDPVRALSGTATRLFARAQTMLRELYGLTCSGVLPQPLQGAEPGATL